MDIYKIRLPSQYADGVICIIDLQKKDSEIKILVGCTEEEQEMIYNFHNKTEDMKGIMVSR